MEMQFLSNIKDKITGIKKAAGVELLLLPDNRLNCTITILTLDKKSSLVIEKKEYLEDATLDLLVSKLEKGMPVALVLSGRGILHKNIQDGGTELPSLIQAMLPNARAQDFYIQHSIIPQKSVLVSIVRKEIADPILDFLNKAGIYCISFHLGGTGVSVLSALLNKGNLDLSLTWMEHKLELDGNGNVKDYKFPVTATEKKSFLLDTEKIEDDFLVSYAAAFSAIAAVEPVEPFVESVKNNKEEYINKILFSKLSWSVLGFFLFLLMINFVLFADFSSKNNELVEKERKYSSMFSEMENLSKEVKEKESFLSEAGWLQSSAMTFLADRIAASVPASVKLTDLSINPVDERKSKEEKKELFNTGLILLKGECSRPTELNEWLDKIKIIEKINKAKLVNYLFDNKENKGTFSIEIEIQN
jgi:hypothetical protein